MINIYFKSKLPRICLIALFLTAMLPGTASTQTFSLTTETDICWRASYGRGVGIIPGECSWDSQSKSGLLCYPKCKPGFTIVAGVCWEQCPDKFHDTGVGCGKPKAYGRGAGYVLWNEGKCKRENKQGCEKSGLLWYPKCAPGTHAVGCCICSPDCPAGMVDEGATCRKHSYVVRPITPNCGTKDYDAGLCYNKCNAGYSGVGPVCWGQCPTTHPFNCGAACAKTDKDCKSGIKDQILSVFKVAVNIGSLVTTGGAAGMAAKAAEASAQAAVKAALKAVAKQVAEKFVGQAKSAAHAYIVAELKQQLPNISPALAEKLSAGVSDPDKFDFAHLDPTGIMNVVQAYNKPICKVDPSIPAAPPLVLSEQRAIGPNPCAKMVSDHNYLKVVDIPAAQWTDGLRNTAIVILVNATGIRTPVAQGWDNNQLHNALTADCTHMKEYPIYNTLINMAATKWTDDQRNAAIVIANNATKVDVPRLQGLNNDEIMGLLRGR